MEDKLAKGLIPYNGLLRAYSYHLYIIIVNLEYVFSGELQSKIALQNIHAKYPLAIQNMSIVRARYFSTLSNKRRAARIISARFYTNRWGGLRLCVPDIKRHNYQNRTRYPSLRALTKASIYPRLPTSFLFFSLPFARHNWRETASLHCRLVTTFRFFADDFFHAAYSPTVPSARPPRRAGPFARSISGIRVPKNRWRARCVSLRATIFFLPRTNDRRAARSREPGERGVEKGRKKSKEIETTGREKMRKRGR